ncbi:MAG: pitrilysin family protein [Armatimonadota bacterium]|nr:pitrilysin family protein [Armatimonadota bacterium]
MQETRKKTVLENGLIVVTERMPHVRTLALGIWIGAGPRYEEDHIAGVSHFIEHVLFKGTENRTALDIAKAIDAIGGQMNAFTDKELTCFYVRVLSKHLPLAVEILADMLLHATFDREAIETERQVILEEIKMYEDSPDEMVQDLFVQAIWDGHPLGRPILGNEDSISRLQREDLVAYVAGRYHPFNTVVSVAGEVDHEEVVDLLRKHFGSWQGRPLTYDLDPPKHSPGVTFRSKETEQVHLCLGTRGLPQAHQDRFVAAVLDNILGGGMSSRLFQEIRERRGLVYTISSYLAAYREGGLVVIYAGMSPETGPEVVRLTLQEIERLKKEGVPPEELERAKESLKGSLMLSLESTTNRMTSLARSEIYYGRQFTLDEILEGIDAVTADAVQRLARELFQPGHLALAAVGPFNGNKDLQDRIRREVEAYATA